MNNQLPTNELENATKFFSPKIPEFLPPHKMYKIQIGGELFLLSGASLSSDGPHSYFLDFFQNIENEQLNLRRDSRDQNENTVSNSFDSRMVNVDVQERILFIDRDPEVFRYIYNHLQGYYINIPDEIVYTKLFSDAMYYRLPKLRGLLKNCRFYFVDIGGQSFQIEKSLLRHEGNNKNYFKITAEMNYQDVENFFTKHGKHGVLRPPPQAWSYCARSPELFKEILILLNGGRFEGTHAQRHNLLKEVRFYRLLKLEQELIAHRFLNNPFYNTPEIFLNILDIKADANLMSLTDLDLESPCLSATPNGNKPSAQNLDLGNLKISNQSNTNSIPGKKRKLNTECQLEKITMQDIMSDASKDELSDNKNFNEQVQDHIKSGDEDEIAGNEDCGMIENAECQSSVVSWKGFSYKRPYVDAWGYPMLFQIGNSSHPDEKSRAVDHCFVNTVQTIDADGRILQNKPQQSPFFVDPDCMVDYGTLLLDAEKYCCYISFEGIIARKIYKLLKLVMSDATIRNKYVRVYSDKEEKIVQRILVPSCVKFAVFTLDNKLVKNVCGLLKQESFLKMLSTEKLYCKRTDTTSNYYKIPLCDRSVWRFSFKKDEKTNDIPEVMMIATKVRCGSIKEYNNYF